MDRGGGVRLTREDYSTDARTLAQRLLGMTLVRKVGGVRRAGVIVETEAYLGVEDEAAHSYRGRRTARTEPMYAQPGTAYVYFTYGMHHCMNVVCGAVGEPCAVLLRALEPVEGVDAMFAQRAKARRKRDLCSGPAKLCAALEIDRALSGVDLCAHGSLWIERGANAEERGWAIGNGARIGIGYAGAWVEKPLRWWVEGDEHVSR